MADLAEECQIKRNTLWNFVNQGIRLLVIAGGGKKYSQGTLPLTDNIINSTGTFYILLLMASLNIKSDVMLRQITSPDVIISFANLLRDPRGKYHILTSKTHNLPRCMAPQIQL